MVHMLDIDDISLEAAIAIFLGCMNILSHLDDILYVSIFLTLQLHVGTPVSWIIRNLKDSNMLQLK